MAGKFELDDDPYVRLFWQMKRLFKIEKKAYGVKTTDSELDALTHKFILDNIPNNCESFNTRSFRACLAHVRQEQTEAHGHKKKVYTKIFGNRSWCRRVVAGKNI